MWIFKVLDVWPPEIEDKDSDRRRELFSLLFSWLLIQIRVNDRSGFFRLAKEVGDSIEFFGGATAMEK